MDENNGSTKKHWSHTCDIVTLKDQTHMSAKPPRKGVTMFTQHISSLQYLSQDGYYVEVANPGLRGGVSGKDVKPGAFDVAVNPAPESVEAIKSGMMALLKEKFFNDVVVFDQLIDELVLAGRVTADEAVKMKISKHDFSAFLLTERVMTDHEKDTIEKAIEAIELVKIQTTV